MPFFRVFLVFVCLVFFTFALIVFRERLGREGERDKRNREGGERKRERENQACKTGVVFLC